MSISGEDIEILFDISTPDVVDYFRIWIVVTDSLGKNIKPESLHGDIGPQVSPGADKKIIWKGAVRDVDLRSGVNIQVQAEVAGSDQKDEEPIQEDDPQVKMGSVIAQSLILPGLGLSRATGNPHWIRGGLGYLAVGSAVVFDISSQNSYDQYLLENDVAERDALYSKSVSHGNLSKVMFGCTAMIWVGDIIWNVVAVKKLNAVSAEKRMGLSISPTYEPVSKTLLFAVKYKF
ncbi:MAG: hypothetical protein GY790_06145 [Bacteroidetes bacterium]|nr:hypothetical protein [Bacteroidota bacterium]